MYQKKKDKGPLSYLAIEEKGYSELSKASVSERGKVTRRLLWKLV